MSALFKGILPTPAPPPSAPTPSSSPLYSAPPGSILPLDFDSAKFLKANPWLATARHLFDRPFFHLPPYEDSSARLSTALSRNNPVDLVAAYRLMFFSALAERARRGHAMRTHTGKPIVCEEIAEGFVIERFDDGKTETIVYTGDAKATALSAEYRLGLAFIGYTPATMPDAMPQFMMRDQIISALAVHRVLPNDAFWAGRYLATQLFYQPHGTAGKAYHWRKDDREYQDEVPPLVELELHSMSRLLVAAHTADGVGLDLPHGLPRE